MIYLLCVQMRNVCIKRGSTTVERNLQTPDADPVHRRSSDRAAQNSWEIGRVWRIYVRYKSARSPVFHLERPVGTINCLCGDERSRRADESYETERST